MISDLAGNHPRMPFGIENVLSHKRLSVLRKDSFYNNSMYLTLSRLTSAAASMLFWIIAARFYTQSEVGIATTLISAATLVSTIALLGTNQSIIRYSPIYDKSKVLGTSLRITSYASLVVGVVSLGFTAWWAPDLVMTGAFMIAFMMLTWTTTTVLTTSSAFTAWRKAKQTLMQQVVLASRVLLLIPLITFGALGIVVSMTLSSVLVIAYSAIVILNLGLRVPRIDWSYLRQSLWFSAGNYMSTLLQGLPALVAPLVVFGTLGATDAAVYYMAASLAQMATIVPRACTDSLFVEGSHGEHFWLNAVKALKTSFLFLIPVIAVLFLLGDWLLSIFGSGYAAEGLVVLRLLSISVIFYTLLVVILTWANVARKVGTLVALSVLNCVVTIAVSYLLIGSFGLDGMGIAFIIGYLVSVVIGVVIVLAYRKRVPPARSTSLEPKVEQKPEANDPA